MSTPHRPRRDNFTAGGPFMAGYWSDFLRLASIRSNEAGRGVAGFEGLLPEQKGLACRGETRQPSISRGHESGGHTCEAFTCQRFFTGNPQDGCPIHIVKLSSEAAL